MATPLNWHTLFPEGSFDLVLCHNKLEFVDAPQVVLHGIAKLMRDSSIVLPFSCATGPGEVLKAAIHDGDLEFAERGLDAEWGYESLYDGRVRLFSGGEIVAMLKKAGIQVIAERDVRVLSDYLPAKVSRHADYEGIFELERKLGQHPEFAAVARYTHYLARRSARVSEDAA